MPQYSVWPPKSNFEIQRHQCMPLPPLPGQHAQRKVPPPRFRPSNGSSISKVSASPPSRRDRDDYPNKHGFPICHKPSLPPDFLPLSTAQPYQESLCPIIEHGSPSVYRRSPPDSLDSPKSARQSLLPPAPEHALVYKPAALTQRVECQLSQAANQAHPHQCWSSQGPTSDLPDHQVNSTSSTTDSPRVPSLTHSLSLESVVRASLSSCRPSTDNALAASDPCPVPKKGDRPTPKLLCSSSSPPASSNSELGFVRTQSTAVDVRYYPSRPAPATPRPDEDSSFFWDDDDDDDNVQCQPIVLNFKKSILDFRVRKGSKANVRASLAAHNLSGSQLSAPQPLAKPVAKAVRVLPPAPKLNSYPNHSLPLSYPTKHRSVCRPQPLATPHNVQSSSSPRTSKPESEFEVESEEEGPSAADRECSMAESTMSSKLQTQTVGRVQWVISKVLRR